MNYLAHLALAYPNTDLVIGNFIGDHVRNKDFPRFSKAIQRGVEMHRSIDTFTDNHEVTKTLRLMLFKKHRHISRVLIDVFYDHFLALHFSHFHQIRLDDFTELIHPILLNNKMELPETAQRYLTGMIAQNWLTKYATVEGMEVILTKMAQRSGIDAIADGAESLTTYYSKLNTGFLAFYPDLMAHCRSLKISNNLTAE